MAIPKCENCGVYHTRDNPCNERIAHFLNEKRKPTDTISRRDYIAAMAMQGLISNDFIKKYILMDNPWKERNIDGTAISESNALAIESISLADALIARLDGEKV